MRVACAMELGLDVPGHHQGLLPQDATYRAPGNDLDEEECDAITAFVANLPAPGEFVPEVSVKAERARAGVKTFTKIGCAECHTPILGPIVGIYSDLLLHEMGWI